MTGAPILLRFISGFLRLFFKLLYHQFAWTYDWVAAAVSIGMWKNWVLSVLPFIDHPPVLELGYGPGHLQVELAKKDILCYGLDESRQMGRLARRRLLHSRLVQRLARGISQSLPFPSGSLRQVVATFPSEYILQSETLGEIYRVLAPGGEFVMLPVAWITGDHPFHRMAAGLFRITGQSPENSEELAMEIWAKPILEAGFKVETTNIQMKNSALLLIRATKPDL
jgi:ubiquinone/menaquinone biosynthesis C-methylase UbiE